MNRRDLLAAFLVVSFLTTDALAHHPGENIDEVMGEKERFFQPIDQLAPPFELADADGNPVRLSDFSDKIVILNFIFATCTDICPVHSEVIADVQSKINITPMKDMVQFISVTTDPGSDMPDVLRSYGQAHGLDPFNWTFLTGLPGSPGDATRKLADTYKVEFEPLDGGQQMHGVVTHVIDRGGRFAAKFHGLQFDPMNLVLYINGLSNAPAHLSKSTETGWWSSIRSLFQ